MTNEELQAVLTDLHDVRGMTWREIVQLPDFKGLNHTTVSKHYRGVYITRPDLREMAGLEPRETCGHCHVFQNRKKVWKPWRWRDMSLTTLRLALENREEV